MFKKNISKTIVLSIILTLTIIFTLFNLRFSIYDYFKLVDYKPSNIVLNLANEDTMSNYARQIFYINNPTIQNQYQFSISCPNNDIKQTVVLGCYHGNEGGIYLLKMTDPNLDGVMQVAAAHEMLHGIYDRLTFNQKFQLDQQLTYFYKHVLKNNRVKQEISLYAKTEPGQVLNEMNSTFGTECHKLTPYLERYYKQFFNNRQVVVNYEQNYQNLLLQKEQLINNYDSQLKALNQQITNYENNLITTKQTLNQQLNQINNMSNKTGSSYQLNVTNYNNQVLGYNNQIKTLQEFISQYNQIIIPRNKLASQLNIIEKQIANIKVGKQIN